MSEVAQAILDTLDEMDSELRDHVAENGIEVSPEHVREIVASVQRKQGALINALGVSESQLRRIVHSSLEDRVEEIKLFEDGEVSDYGGMHHG